MNARRAGARMLLVASAVALAVLCVRGVLVRYNADDFWTASIVTRLGFWKSQSFWYQRWSGRFAYTFLIGIVERIGPRIVPLLVPAMIAGWFAATFVLLRRLNVACAAALAAVIVYAATEGAPDVPQSVLWQTGLLTYVLPLAGITAWFATTVDRDRLRWYDAVVPFLLAGFSEGNTIVQLIALAALTVRTRSKVFGVALVASLIAFVIVGLAPGNAVRIATSVPHTTAWIASTTARSSAEFLLQELTRSGIPLLFVLVAFIGRAEARRSTVVLLWVIAICGTVAICLVSAITLPTGPSVRTMIVPHAFIVIAVAATGALLQRFERYALPLIVLLAIAGPIVDAVQRGRNIPEAAAFARAWDRLDADLRQNAGHEVIVDGAPGSVGTLRFITHDPDNWSNHCIADYYRLSGIASTPRLLRTKPFQDLPVYATEGPRRHDDNHIVRLRFASD